MCRVVLCVSARIEIVIFITHLAGIMLLMYARG